MRFSIRVLFYEKWIYRLNVLLNRGVLALSYEDKYKMNKTWADSAYQGSAYDVAVNRYYYCIFQKMLYKLQQNGKVVPRRSGENSHNNTAKIYAGCFIMTDHKKRIQFNSKFQELKKYRNNADYQDNCISEKNASKAIKVFRIIDNIVV